MALLPVLFQRCLLFMLAHGVPMFLVIICLPQILRATGQPPAVCDLVQPYRWGLAAALPLEILIRYSACPRHITAWTHSLCSVNDWISRKAHKTATLLPQSWRMICQPGSPYDLAFGSATADPSPPQSI